MAERAHPGPARVTTEIAVVGDGLAGRLAAAALRYQGREVLRISPAHPGTDSRTTALMADSVRMLDALAGIGPALESAGTPFEVMEVADDSRAARGRVRAARFAAARIGKAYVFFNMPNADLLAALGAQAGPLRATRVTGLRLEADVAVLACADGGEVAARLVLAADGVESPLRKMAGLGLRRLDHRRHALSFTCRHTAPHGGVCQERYAGGGSLTLVPMGSHEAGVIWTGPPGRIDALAALTDAALAAELARAAGPHLGPDLGRMEITSGRGRFPLELRLARRLAAGRIALIGEAAHAMSPIGAQGFNVTVGDVAALHALLASQAPGADPAAIARPYARRRRRAVMGRLALGALATMTGTASHPFLTALRGPGLALLDRGGPLKSAFARTLFDCTHPRPATRPAPRDGHGQGDVAATSS